LLTPYLLGMSDTYNNHTNSNSKWIKSKLQL